MNGDAIFVQETQKGRAVFAKKHFKKGDFILQFRGETYSREEYLKLHDPENNHFVQIGSDLFLGPSGKADDLINHSCDPNCGILITDRGIFLRAIRKIEANEEITFDYSTTMDEDHWEMECCCGHENCRKIVRDFKYLPEEIKRWYIELGIVPSYISARYVRVQYIEPLQYIEPRQDQQQS